MIWITTKLLISSWSHPSKNFFKIRPQLLQLFCGQTDRWTEKWKHN